MSTNTSENSTVKEEEDSLFLSMIDTTILQKIFIDLVNSYKYSVDEREIKKAFTFLINFPESCKLFLKISKQDLFPLTLNNINIDLNWKKYLQILFIKEQVKIDNYCKEKDINDMFYQTCIFNYFEIINTLVNYGANINHVQLDDYSTPIILATSHKKIKTIKKLIKFENLYINDQNMDGMTSLVIACMNQNEDIVKILLSRKDIDINIEDGDEMTALDWAKNNEYKNLIKILENHQ